MNNLDKPKYSKKNKIVIISDCVDIAYNELYQVLNSELEKLEVYNYQIDPLVSVKNFSIVNAAFVIRLMAEIYSPGTIFLVVVNGNHNNPIRIFGKTKNDIIFVGNNSGYFNWMLKDFGLDFIYKNNLDRQVNNRSFGGKYVQAPTVAKLLSKVSFLEIGDPLDASDISDYQIPNGTVVHCDNFGLMKIKHSKITELEEGSRLKILVNGNYTCDAVYSNKMKNLPDGTWVLFPGSSFDSMPELGRVRANNSAEELHVLEGDIISWEVI